MILLLLALLQEPCVPPGLPPPEMRDIDRDNESRPVISWIPVNLATGYNVIMWIEDGVTYPDGTPRIQPVQGTTVGTDGSYTWPYKSPEGSRFWFTVASIQGNCVGRWGEAVREP